ncbi:MAG TPA: DUF3826 domain-containing protein [Verrucomicrobiae bacterium]|jgi:hypothetical protein|nr:DUF3826 domain-containing protein [Verrucomicrobiae bacterium]
MKKLILNFLIAAAFISAGFAAEKSPAKLTPEQAEAEYTHVIDARSQKIVDALGLSDTNTAAKVHDIIMAQYRALNSWHNANDPRIKAAHRDKAIIAKINEPLRKMHDEYLARLAQYLTPEQIETVKDKMTYGKVQFTFKGYTIEYPDLSEANKREVLNYLKQAREEAMDAGSSEEKSAIFNQYKGKINNYLSRQGIQSVRAKAKKNSKSKQATP